MSKELEELKSTFDLVTVKHLRSNTYQGTHVALVKDGKVFIGISKCHRKDQFNKRLGLKIAIGRAMHSWKVDAGIEPSRMNTQEAIIADCQDKIDKAIEELRKEPDSVTEIGQIIERSESAGGCCGGGCNNEARDNQRM